MDRIQIPASLFEQRQPDISDRVLEGKRIIKVPKHSQIQVPGFGKLPGDEYDYLIRVDSAEAVNYADSMDPDNGMTECSRLEHDVHGILDELDSEQKTDSALSTVYGRTSDAIEQYCLRKLTIAPEHTKLNTKVLDEYGLRDEPVKENIAEVVSAMTGAKEVSFPADLSGVVEHAVFAVEKEGIKFKYEYQVKEEVDGHYSEVRWVTKTATSSISDCVPLNVQESLDRIRDYQQRELEGRDAPNPELITTTYINMVISGIDPSKRLPLPDKTPVGEILRQNETAQ